MKIICQSCAMPLKKDPTSSASNADGSKNETYCGLCYQEGRFTRPHITAKEMQAICIEKMMEMQFPKLIAWLLTRNIPTLTRWTSQAK